MPLFKNICEQTLKLLAFELITHRSYKPGDLVRMQSKNSLLNYAFRDRILYHQAFVAKKILNLKREAEISG